METTERTQKELMLLLEQAENLYFQYRLTEAKVVFQKLLDEKIGRAAYYLYDISTLSSQENDSNSITFKNILKKGIELNDSYCILKAINNRKEFGDFLNDKGDFTVSDSELTVNCEKGSYSMSANKINNAALHYEISVSLYKKFDKEQGFYFLSKSAEAGYWKAKNMLAIKYYEGKEGIKKDRKKAHKIWQELALINYEPAIFNAFSNAKDGPDKASLRKDFDRIANQGYAHAMNYRGYCRWYGSDGYEQDSELAIADLERAAEKGDSRAIKALTAYKKKNSFGFWDWNRAGFVYY